MRSRLYCQEWRAGPLVLSEAYVGLPAQKPRWLRDSQRLRGGADYANVLQSCPAPVLGVSKVALSLHVPGDAFQVGIRIEGPVYPVCA